MKRFCGLLLILSLLLSGCAAKPAAPRQYTATFLTLFDTVTTVVGPGETEEAFRAKAQKAAGSQAHQCPGLLIATGKGIFPHMAPGGKTL